MKLSIRFLIFVSCMGLTACQISDEAKDSISRAFALKDSQGDPQPAPAPAPACYLNRYTQPEGQITRSVDILFVTDTSGSLDEYNGGERGAIADGIDSFVGALPPEVDYQVAVMLGHSSRSNHSGMLYKYQNNPYVLSSKTMSLSAIRKSLRANLTYVAGDNFGDGGEEMLYSFNRALTLPGALAASRAHGFFRPDAALAVVFITDENDICYPGKVIDREHQEEVAFKADCKGINAASILEKVKALQGDRPFLISGIYYNDPNNVPRQGENEFGFGIDDIVRLAKGVSVNLADGHYDEGLAEIGRMTTIKLQLKTEFALSNLDNIDVSSIGVKVDGVSVPFVFNAADGKVELAASDAGRSLSVVDISYCDKPAPQPTPSPSPSPVPTASPTPEPSPSPSPSPEPTVTPSPEPSPEPTPSSTPSPSPEPTASPSPEPSPSPTPDPTPTPSPTCNPGDFGCGGGPIGA